MENVVKLAPLGEIGSQGLSHWSGRINEDYLKALQGINKFKIYNEMRNNDPVIGATLFAIDMLIRNVKWDVKTKSVDNIDLQRTDFVKTCLHDMSTSWENTISEILSFLWQGFSYHEIVYKARTGESKNPAKNSRYNDGLIGWRKIPIRAQETIDRWDIDDHGGIKGAFQLAPPKYKETFIPIDRALLFRTTTYKGDPQGRSILKNAYRPWYIKKHIEEIQGIGIERDLAGLPIIYAPGRIMASTANAVEAALYENLKDIVRNVRRDEQEGVILPSDTDDKGNRLFDMKLLSTGGQRQFDTRLIIQYYDQRIAMTALTDVILLGHERVGSFALASSKTNMLSMALGAYLAEIQSIFNRHAIPRLFALNGWTTQNLPQIQHGDLETPDLDTLGNFIQRMAASGILDGPDPDLDNALREFASLPTREV